MGKSTYTMGDRSKRTRACDGGGSEIFATLVRAS